MALSATRLGRRVHCPITRPARALVLGLVLVSLLNPVEGRAQRLSIAVAARIQTLDPYQQAEPDQAGVLAHLYDALTRFDARQRLLPGLATAWRSIGDRTWQFELRRGARFHDGTRLEAADVVASLDAARDAPALARHLQGTTTAVIDDFTIQVRTDQPNPLLPNALSFVPILSRHSIERPESAPLGTGPFRLVRLEAGDRLQLAANAAYWGVKPAWSELVIRFVDEAERRVELLRDRQVDLIAAPGASALAGLRADPSLRVQQRISTRLIYLQMDQARDETSYVQGLDGAPLPNPLKDRRVREALSLAIDRDALASGLLAGTAIKTAQLMPPGLPGYSTRIDAPGYDPEGARALLEQAGLGQGFVLTLHGPQDHYRMGREVLRLIGQMLLRVGIRTQVSSMPKSVYFKRASRGGNDGSPEFSMMLLGWTSDSGDALDALNAFVHGFDKSRRLGLVNRGRYRNPRVDELIEAANATLARDKRRALLELASEIALNERAVLPLYHEVNTWVSRSGIDYVPRMDGRTYALDARRERD
ncbi:MAG: ABC transporter substrate-binding protein [Gammaproteobacteria bacterium]|nr:ABC transporter substrate-binding protein [Gammaproteobacteria bacterium]